MTIFAAHDRTNSAEFTQEFPGCKILYVAPPEFEGHVPVLLFHGVPVPVHEWVDTSPEFFRKCMKYLYDNGYRVISMKQMLKQRGLL